MPPPSIANTLLGHYDASTLGLTNGATVTTWPDSSGNGFDLIDPGANDPTYILPALNGMGGVSFGASARRRATGVTSYTNCTAFIVAVNPSNGNGTPAYFNDQTAAKPFLAKWTQNDRWVWGVSDSGGTFIEFTEASLVDQPAIWTGTVQATGAILRHNQTQKVSGNLSGVAATTRIEIGNNGIGDWVVCEYLLYDGIASGGDIDLVEDYLFSKWFEDTASGAISWAGVATGAVDHYGSASGSISWAGSALGPAPPVVVTSVATPWLEVWTRPGDATYRKKIADLPFIQSSVQVPYSGVGKGNMTLPANYTRLDEILTVDITDSSNSVWSTIKVVDESGWLYEWLPIPRTPQGSKNDTGVEFAGDGPEAIWGFARVEPWDWDGEDDFVSTFPDWIWGGSNLLSNPGFEESGPSPIIDEVWITDATGGDWFLTDGTNDTIDFAWDEDNPSIIEGALEAAGIYDDCLVGGTGTEDDPFVIEAVDPFEGVDMAVDGTGLTGTGDEEAHIRRVQFGSLQPTGWTKSITVSDGTPRPFGAFDSFRVSGEQVHSGSYALRMDPAPVETQSLRYAGAQQVVQTKPGGIYQASIWIRSTSATDTYRFVIRGIDGDFIKSSTGGLSSFTLTANTWTQVTITDVNVGTNSAVIFRIANTNPAGTNPAVFYIDDAEFNEGLVPTTVGCMLQALYDDAVTDHAATRIVWENEADSPNPYLTLDFDCDVDSNGSPWDRDDVNQTFQPRMSYLQVLDQIVEEGGYNWRVVPDDWTQGTYLLQVYNGGAMGGVQEAGIIGGSRDTSRQAKFFAPSSTAQLAQGAGNASARVVNSGLIATFGRIEGAILDQNWTTMGSLSSAAIMMNTEQLRGAESVVYTLASPRQRPLVAYRPGDRIFVTDPPVVDEVRRVAQIQLSMSKGQPDQFVVHISDAIPFRLVGGAGVKLSRGLTGQAATDNAVAALLEAFKRPEPAPTANTILFGGGGQPTVTVAASDASDISKGKADLVCDGSLDDQTIQQAFDMLPARGGKVVLTEGIFRFGPTGVILPGSNWHLHGMGPDATVCLAEEAASYLFIDGINTGEDKDQQISDMSFDGNNETVTAITNPGLAGGQNGVLVQNIYVHDFTGNGISLPRPAGSWRFRSCRFHSNTGIGLYAREAGVDAVDCIFEENGSDGLTLEQTDFGRILGNHFRDNGGHGMGTGNAISQGIGGFTINDNHFRDNGGYGLQIQDGSNNIIEGNYFASNTTGSIGLGAGAFGVATVIFITGNLQQGAGTFVTIAAGSSAIQTNNVVNGTLVP